MGRSDENDPGVIGPSHLQGGLHAGGGGKFMAATGQNRPASSAINWNVIGAPPFPCAVKKRPLSEKFAAEMANKLQIKPEGDWESGFVVNIFVQCFWRSFGVFFMGSNKLILWACLV